jgi:hypothetical protein
MATTRSPSSAATLHHRAYAGAFAQWAKHITPMRPCRREDLTALERIGIAGSAVLLLDLTDQIS